MARSASLAVMLTARLAHGFDERLDDRGAAAVGLFGLFQ